MYLAGIDIKFIQYLLGHSKVEQTLNYIKISAAENAINMLRSNGFVLLTLILSGNAII